MRRQERAYQVQWMLTLHSTMTRKLPHKHWKLKYSALHLLHYHIIHLKHATFPTNREMNEWKMVVSSEWWQSIHTHTSYIPIRCYCHIIFITTYFHPAIVHSYWLSVATPHTFLTHFHVRHASDELKIPAERNWIYDWGDVNVCGSIQYGLLYKGISFAYLTCDALSR